MSPAARTTKIAIALSVLAIAARFILIDQPFIDRWSWRESDVAAIARNFLQNGFHFARPQIDWAGDQPGYVGTEFPILPFMAALCYKIFGVHEWVGRSQAVVFFALSLPFFFLMVRQVFGPLAAVWALFFYSFAPLAIMTSRCFMPDVPSLSLALIALYFFMRWIEHRQWTAFFLSAVALSLSILIKATSGVIAAPLLYLLVAALCERRNLRAQKDSDSHRPPLQMLALFAIIAVLPSAAWYWHAYQIARASYPFHFFGEGGITIENLAWYWEIAWRTVSSSLTPLLSILALIGLFIAPRPKFARVFHWWLIAMVLFILTAGYGNRHPWYQLSFVPISCALAGTACAVVASKVGSATTKLVWSIFLAATFLCLAIFYTVPFYEPVAASFHNAGLELKKITPRDALIVAADDGNPTLFYYAERKGWHFPEQHGMWEGGPRDSEQAIVDLEQLRTRGASYFVFPRDTFWWLNYYTGFVQYLKRSAELIKATDNFKIYRLHNTP